MKYNSRAVNPLLIAVCISLSTFLISCQKDQPGTEPEPKEKKLIKIIDWGASYGRTDSVPAYSVEYVNGRISALVGKYGDTIKLQYQLEYSQPMIIRRRRFGTNSP